MSQDWFDPETWNNKAETHDAATVLDVIARSAHDAYYNIMARRYGTHKPRTARAYLNNRFWKAFREIAEFCISEGWDEATYIDFALGSLHFAHHGNITPRALVNATTVNAYREERRNVNSGYSPRKEWVDCGCYLIDFITQGFSEAETLLNPFRDFPPWFRVLYPKKLDPEIFEMWGELARKELLERRELRKFIREVAPDQFSEVERHWGKFSDSQETATCQP